MFFSNFKICYLKNSTKHNFCIMNTLYAYFHFSRGKKKTLVSRTLFKQVLTSEPQKTATKTNTPYSPHKTQDPK